MSALGSVDLNIGRSSLAGARCFSFLCLCRGLEQYDVSLAIDVMSELAPPMLVDEGGELAGASLTGHTFFGGLPLGLEACVAGTFSPSAPLTGVGGVLPTNTGPTSDSLEKGAPSAGPCGSILSL